MSDTMIPGDILRSGDQLNSADGRFKLFVTNDGTVRLYRFDPVGDPTILWYCRHSRWGIAQNQGVFICTDSFLAATSELDLPRERYLWKSTVGYNVKREPVRDRACF
jgi:hypothetical protein